MENSPQPEPAKFTKSLEALRPLVSPADILPFQQFVRAAERVDIARNPETKDVRRICDELLKVVLKTGVVSRQDMVSHPLIITGMAQMLLIMADAQPFGESVITRDHDLFKQAVGMILDATCFVAMGHAQMVAHAINEKDSLKPQVN